MLSILYNCKPNNVSQNSLDKYYIANKSTTPTTKDLTLHYTKITTYPLFFRTSTFTKLKTFSYYTTTKSLYHPITYAHNIAIFMCSHTFVIYFDCTGSHLLQNLYFKYPSFKDSYNKGFLRNKI